MNCLFGGFSPLMFSDQAALGYMGPQKADARGRDPAAAKQQRSGGHNPSVQAPAAAMSPHGWLATWTDRSPDWPRHLLACHVGLGHGRSHRPKKIREVFWQIDPWQSSLDLEDGCWYSVSQQCGRRLQL